MTLHFPNQSRSFDSTRRAVRFWGHDNALEFSFFVTEGALMCIQPGLECDEAGLLSAFDTNREVIHVAALKAYTRSLKGSYDLVSGNF